MKKGMFWCCPIYWETKTQTLSPRHFLLWPLFEIVLFIHHSMLFFAAFIGAEIEEGYPLKLNAKAK
jgi:hypothetical protein